MRKTKVMVMRAISSLLSLAVIICVPALAFAQGSPAVFQSFDVPGATDTQATAITPSGEIVGRYFNPDGSLHGFLLQNGTFSSIDVPGATSTDVNWINASGEIVGAYNDGQFFHGFLLSKGQFTTIDDPGEPNTILTGIGSDCEILGNGNDGITFLGFALRNGIFSSVMFPSGSNSFQEPTMVAAGRIVGGYIDGNGIHGYLLVRGVFQSIDCAPGGTFLSGIDSIGRMVGGMTTADGHSHGLLVMNGVCTAVDYPGSTASYANSINPGGDIAGRYTDASGQTHGFVVRRFVQGRSAQ
jgi:uncharacterized membrane protein